MKLLNPHQYAYSFMARKICNGETWYRIFSADNTIQVAFCKAENDEDTLHRALQDLRDMGYNVSGTQVITKKEAVEMNLKLYVFWNIYGEAKDVVLYEFAEDSISSTRNKEKKTLKLEKSHYGITYSVKKTKVKTDGESLKNHVTCAMSPLGAFNAVGVPI